jgi:hypothetical protein
LLEAHPLVAGLLDDVEIRPAVKKTEQRMHERLDAA